MTAVKPGDLGAVTGRNRGFTGPYCGQRKSIIIKYIKYISNLLYHTTKLLEKILE